MSDDGFKVTSPPSHKAGTHLIQASDILSKLSTTFDNFTTAERAAQIKKVRTPARASSPAHHLSADRRHI